MVKKRFPGLLFAFRNTASLVSVSKLYRDFASLGFNVSKNTRSEYLGYLEDFSLLFLLPKQDRFLRKHAPNPKKLHVLDSGLVAAFQGTCAGACPSRTPTAKPPIPGNPAAPGLIADDPLFIVAAEVAQIGVASPRKDVTYHAVVEPINHIL